MKKLLTVSLCTLLAVMLLCGCAKVVEHNIDLTGGDIAVNLDDIVTETEQKEDPAEEPEEAEEPAEEEIEEVAEEAEEDAEEEEEEEAAEAEPIEGEHFSWRGYDAVAKNLEDDVKIDGSTPKDGYKFVKFYVFPAEGLFVYGDINNEDIDVVVKDSEGTEYAYTHITYNQLKFAPGFSFATAGFSIPDDSEFENLELVYAVPKDKELSEYTLCIGDTEIPLVDIPVIAKEAEEG